MPSTTLVQPPSADMSMHHPNVKSKMFNANPAHFGSKGAENPSGNYGTLWGYDEHARRGLVIVKSVPFNQLSLPFIYHKMVMDDDGRLGVKAMLVTKALVPN